MVRRSDTRRPDPRRSANRGLGLGAELAGALIGFTLVGLWIDHSFDTSPWGTLICVGFGLVGGFYNFLRSSLRLLNAPVVSGSRRATGDSTTPGPHQESPDRTRARGDDEEQLDTRDDRNSNRGD